MHKVKICGNHHETDLQHLATFQDQVDHIGFIFTKVSKRYVSPQQVVQWMKTYPFLQKKAVGVFLNQEIEEVKDIIRMTGIKTIQLHGQESTSYVQELKRGLVTELKNGLNKNTREIDVVSIWKVLPVEQGRVKGFQQYVEVVDALLLDTQVKGQSGGTGQRFDWSIIPDIKRLASQHHIPLWIAGGITPHNVEELVSTYPLDGIDLASGVETNGAKDRDKIKALVEGVGRYGNTAASKG
jgi:phosphoribosylanthranilate isomerase